MVQLNTKIFWLSCGVTLGVSLPSSLKNRKIRGRFHQKKTIIPSSQAKVTYIYVCISYWERNCHAEPGGQFMEDL
jgi:hypothetical protein